MDSVDIKWQTLENINFSDFVMFVAKFSQIVIDGDLDIFKEMFDTPDVRRSSPDHTSRSSRHPQSLLSPICVRTPPGGTGPRRRT